MTRFRRSKTGALDPVPSGQCVKLYDTVFPFVWLKGDSARKGKVQESGEPRKRVSRYQYHSVVRREHGWYPKWSRVENMRTMLRKNTPNMY